MIRLKRTIDSADFENIKINAKQTAPIIASLSLNDIRFASNDILDVGGRQVRLPEHMFRQMMQQIAIPFRNQKKLKDNYGDDALYEFGNLLLRTAPLDDKYLLSFDNKDGTVVGFNKLNNPLIPMETCYRFIDVLRNHFNLEIGEVLFHFNNYGMSVNMYLPNESQIFTLGKEEEHIHGVSVNMNADNVQLTNYVNRLVCENGSVVTLSENRHSLSEIKSDTIKESIQFLNTSKYETENKMKKSYSLCNRTKASITEVERASKNLEKLDIPDDYIVGDFPMNRYKHDYSKIGIDLDECSMAEKSGMESDMTVWELYNKMTAFASHTEHLDVHSPFRYDLMNTAAKIVGGRSLDLANRFPSPY